MYSIFLFFKFKRDKFKLSTHYADWGQIDMGPKISGTSASQAPGVSNPEMAAGGDPLSNSPTNIISIFLCVSSHVAQRFSSVFLAGSKVTA